MFDNNNVSFALNFHNPPAFANPPATQPLGSLGEVQHTLGSPRLIRMSLHFYF